MINGEDKYLGMAASEKKSSYARPIVKPAL